MFLLCLWSYKSKISFLHQKALTLLNVAHFGHLTLQSEIFLENELLPINS